MRSSRELALQAVEVALGKNALQPVLLDVIGHCAYTDFILVLSGASRRQVEAIAEAVEVGLKQRGFDPLGVEGERDSQWVLLDFGDVVIHVFYHPVRDFYDIEGLWADASHVAITVPPELRAVAL